MKLQEIYKTEKTLAASYLHKAANQIPSWHASSFIRVFASPRGPGLESRFVAI